LIENGWPDCTVLGDRRWLFGCRGLGAVVAAPLNTPPCHATRLPVTPYSGLLGGAPYWVRLCTLPLVLHALDTKRKVCLWSRYRPGASAPAAGHVRTYANAEREFKFGARLRPFRVSRYQQQSDCSATVDWGWGVALCSTVVVSGAGHEVPTYLPRTTDTKHIYIDFCMQILHTNISYILYGAGIDQRQRCNCWRGLWFRQKA